MLFISDFISYQFYFSFTVSLHLTLYPFLCVSSCIHDSPWSPARSTQTSDTELKVSDTGSWNARHPHLSSGHLDLERTRAHRAGDPQRRPRARALSSHQHARIQVNMKASPTCNDATLGGNVTLRLPRQTSAVLPVSLFMMKWCLLNKKYKTWSISSFSICISAYPMNSQAAAEVPSCRIAFWSQGTQSNDMYEFDNRDKG